MGDFRLLSYSEESKLSLEELKKYYIELKNYLASLNVTKNEKDYLTSCEKNNKYIRFILQKIKGYELIIENEDLIPEEPVIFASSHQDFYDHFNLIIAVPTHSIILNNVNILPITKQALNINGVVFVNRDESQSKFESKYDLMKYIAKDKSVIIFPEATYNISPNKLVLPIHGGVIDIAKKMQVPIVPVVQEYEYKKIKDNGKYKVKTCILRFGAPIYVNYQDNNQEKKEELRNSLATLRYDIRERTSIIKRRDISNEEYINYLLSRIRTFEKQRTSYPEEEHAIYGVKDDFYNYFPINALQYDENHQILQRSFTKKVSFNK